MPAFRASVWPLPGLAIATGRYAIAGRMLRTLARFVDGGMLPNVFPDAGQPAAYNSVDAALWYVEAVRRYAAATGCGSSRAIRCAKHQPDAGVALKPP